MAAYNVETGYDTYTGHRKVHRKKPEESTTDLNVLLFDPDKEFLSPEDIRRLSVDSTEREEQRIKESLSAERKKSAEQRREIKKLQVDMEEEIQMNRMRQQEFYDMTAKMDASSEQVKDVADAFNNMCRINEKLEDKEREYVRVIMELREKLADKHEEHLYMSDKIDQMKIELNEERLTIEHMHDIIVEAQREANFYKEQYEAKHEECCEESPVMESFEEDVERVKSECKSADVTEEVYVGSGFQPMFRQWIDEEDFFEKARSLNEIDEEIGLTTGTCDVMVFNNPYFDRVEKEYQESSIFEYVRRALREFVKENKLEKYRDKKRACYVWKKPSA